jgi:hypothetical protein
VGRHPDLPRWSPSGTFQVRVTTLDRIGRRASVDFDTSTITVVDENPDLDSRPRS